MQLFAQARTLNGPQWAEPQWSLVVGEPILPVIVPICVRGQFRGVIGAAIGTSDLSRFLKSLELAGERKPFILAGRDKVLAHPWLGKEQGSAEQRARGRLSGPERGQRSGAGRDVEAEPERDLLAERRRQHGLGPLELGRRQQPWPGSTARSTSTKPASLIIGYHMAGRESAWARWIVRGILIAGGVLMLLTAIIAIMVGRRLSQPILALADAARAVERLELEKVPQLGDSKVRELNLANRAFERMARGLRLAATYLPRALVERLIAQQARAAARARIAPSPSCSPDLEGYAAYTRGRPAAEAATLSQRPAGARRSGDRGDGRHHRQVHRRRADGLLGRTGAQRPTTRAPPASARWRWPRRGRDVQPRAPFAGQDACRMRVGLHTGTVLVGNVGFAGRVDYTAIGEAVNVAPRLEQFGRGAPRHGEVTIVASASCRTAALDGFLWLPLDGGPADVAADAVPCHCSGAADGLIEGGLIRGLRGEALNRYFSTKLPPSAQQPKHGRDGIGMIRGH